MNDNLDQQYFLLQKKLSSLTYEIPKGPCSRALVIAVPLQMVSHIACYILGTKENAVISLANAAILVRLPRIMS